MPEAILSIDEGTSGTRAAIVDADGRTHNEHYQRLTTDSPAPGLVEQDAARILRATRDVLTATWSEHDPTRHQVVGVAVSTQRATAVLWDTVTGEPLTPAVVWQDTRYATELAEAYADSWDERLRARTGRPTGVRSPYLWAAHQLRENPRVCQAYADGRLGFGTIDTWLIWNLSAERALVTSATNATAGGALDLREFCYLEDWLTTLGFPPELAPRLIDDAAPVGTLDAELVGRPLPILAAVGDQHAALVGLGCTHSGDAMVVHGTGSFVDLCTGDDWPAAESAPDGTLVLTGWRAAGRSSYTLETFAAATGSALSWACDRLGWFDSPEQMTEIAASVADSGGVTFLPSITGMRSPVMAPHARGALRGLSTATTAAHVARAMVEGVAHFVTQANEDNVSTAAVRPTRINVGGGLAASDLLLQVQADLMGIPVHRVRGAASASLRGAAYLAGSQLPGWPALGDLPDNTLRVFEPSISTAARQRARSAWRAVVDQEVQLGREES
ncbi:glycerol kinase [Enemella evansiae]|uniref:FGGY family carbohydrate kinase n=1 Tax=Enemella evansiae TaxID=2016499 RepID=UPI000B9782E7|nr:FGGY family carbohydrate kinase [Enemella evansiae]OYO08271.1 glycerol kinase [Enemella evansiae]